jgi:Domain of unknown function (DUF4276)
VIKRISLIVEGKGDVFAAASLLTKVAAKFNLTSVVVGNPIRAGEAKKLRRAGELERFVLLAAGHNSDEIFILLDLDDGCPKDWQMEFHHRAETALEGTTKRVRLCFCLREFEGWFLTSIGHLREALPEYGILRDALFTNAEDILGAKEQLCKVCSRKRYRPMRDQNVFAKKVNIDHLIKESRSFRKFVKEVTGLTYEAMTEAMPTHVG